MAKVTGPLMSLSARGKLGGALVFLPGSARAVARSLCRVAFDAARGATPKATAAQAAHRARWTQGCANWHALTDEQRQVYHDRAARLAVTGFSLYMSENLPLAGTVWDGGATTFDGGSTTWDVGI